MLSSPLLSHSQKSFQVNRRVRPNFSPLQLKSENQDAFPEASTPTLQRFSRYNKSTRYHSFDFPSPISEHLDDFDAPSSGRDTHSPGGPGRNGFYASSDTREPHQPRSPSGSGLNEVRARQSEKDSNWILRNNGPALCSSSLNSRHITVISPSEKESQSLRGTFSKLKQNAASADTKFLTHGRLRLVKSNSLGCHNDVSTARSSARVRKTVFGLFEDREKCCCHCAPKTKKSQPLASPKVPPNPSPRQLDVQADLGSEASFLTLEMPPHSPDEDSGVGTPLVSRSSSLHEDSSHKNTSDIPPSPSDYSGSSISLSRSSSLRSSHRYRSCPDLVDNLPAEEQKTTWQENHAKCVTLDAAFKRQRRRKMANGWQTKPLKTWNLDDALGWLQHLGLDEVASLVVGYDLSGSDLEQWNEQILDNLQVNPRSKAVLLKELKALKEKPVCERTLHRKARNQSRCSLYPLIEYVIRESKQAPEETPQAILAATLPPGISCRQFSVAEGPAGGLVVTRVKEPFLPLVEGDCIIELDGQSCLHMPAVDFNLKISLACEAPRKVVLIRSRPAMSKSASLYDSSSMSKSLSFAETISSGVDHSDAKSPHDIDNFAIMHF